MKKLFALLGVVLGLAFAAPALASNCASYPYTLTNGQTADANQVMANFNSILGCGNNNLAHNAANSDITSLSGLTTPLSIAQGGSGQTSAGAALTAFGGLAAANNLSDLASATTARTNLGLGTAATQNTGTSGATIPLLNGANTWSAKQTLFASVTGGAPFNIPQGVAPTSPANGDCWTTSTGVFCQIAGSTLTLASTSGAVTSFNTRTGAITLTSSDVTTALTYTPANIASPTFTGTPAAPTPASNINTTQIPTSAWVNTYFPTKANNLSDIASASTARTNLGLGTAATQNTGTSGASIPFLNGLNTWSGTQVLGTSASTTTPSPGDNSTKLASTAFVAASFAPLASPAFTGSTPTSNGTAVVLTTDARFGGVTQNSQGSAGYTLALTDAGGQVYHPSADTTARTWTIPANASVAFPVGSKVDLVNDCSAGIITLAITSDTMVFFSGGSTGSRSIAACGEATITKVGTTRWIIVGVGVT